MHKSTRRIIFYSLVLLFIILGTGIVFYAQGWRLDGGTWEVNKVGAIYVVPSPITASITLNGEPVKSNSGIFQQGTLINGVFPHAHTLELSAPGYLPWKRTVDVFPSKVTELQYVVLIPESSSVQASGSFHDFWKVDGSFLLRTGDTDFMFRNWHIASTSAPLGWTKDRTRFLAEDAEGDPIFVNLEQATTTSLTALIRRAPIVPSTSTPRLIVDEEGDARLFVATPRAFSIVDAATNTVTPVLRTPTSTTIGVMASSRSLLAWAVNDAAATSSRVVFYDRFANRFTDTQTAVPDGITSLRFVSPSLLAILTAKGDLFTYDIERRTPLVHLAREVRMFSFAPSGKHLATVGGRGVEIISFDTNDYSRFNLRDASDITALEWYRNEHNLFLHYPDRVVYLESDDGLQENFTVLASTTHATYDGASDRFYFIDTEGSLRFLQFAKQ